MTEGRGSALGLLVSLSVVSCMPKCREPARAEPRVLVGVAPIAAAADRAAAADGAPAPTGGKVIGPDGPLAPQMWTDDELSKDVALHTVRQTDAASYHVVRLLRAEKPHVHDRSDLTVYVLSGAVNMHIGGRVVAVAPGDVIDVPKGVAHWAENASQGPSYAYVVFAPAFDGKDRRPVDDPAAIGGSAR